MLTAYGTALDRPACQTTAQTADAWCGVGPETHSGVLATRVFEFTAPDPHSTTGEGDTHYLAICDGLSCLAAAEAEARYWHATHQDFYPATAADLAAILGAA